MVIGIDLGTTFSVGAYVDENGTPHVVNNRDGSNTTPSVVMFDDSDVLVGVQAKNNAALDPVNVVQFVKRNMGNHEWQFESDAGDTFTAEEISAMILKRIREDCENVIGSPVTSAVITVPAYFNDSQRQATMDAGKLAGLDVLAVINEPTAAALAYGMTKLGQPQKVMVYDLGGGTCDVTIMEISPDGSVKVLATHGNRNLGGYDFDNRLISHVAQLFNEETGVDIEDDDEAMQMLRSKCEEAKIALSSSEKFRIALVAGGKKFKTEITRDTFEELIKDLIDDTDIDIDTALEDSGLVPRDIDKVLLVGGSTRVPAVRAFVEKRMLQKPSAELNPDEVVAIGAAIYANEVQNSRGSGDGRTGGGDSSNLPVPVIQDVNSHGLGVVAVIDRAGNLGNSIIIPRNQPIPVVMEQEYSTVVDDQTEIELQVTEGDDEDLSYVTVVGTAMIHLNPHPAQSPIRVELGYDKNGIIVCKVFDVYDNCYIGNVEFTRDANMSDEEIRQKKKKMDKLSVQ